MIDDIKPLVAKARNHYSDSNALKLCWQLADALENYATALERQQAVVAAAQLYTKSYDEAAAMPTGEMWGKTMKAVNGVRQEIKALAALDAPPEHRKP